MHPYTARRRKTRIAGQIQRRVDKLMRRLPQCDWVLAYRYLGETATAAETDWNAIGTHRGLVKVVAGQTPAYDEALAGPEGDGPQKPTNSVVRASACRAMLKDAWLEHVRGTPFEGKVQMYAMVERGEVEPFPWWTEVVGHDVPFVHTSVNSPEVSNRLWDYLIRRQKKC